MCPLVFVPQTENDNEPIAAIVGMGVTNCGVKLLLSVKDTSVGRVALQVQLRFIYDYLEVEFYSRKQLVRFVVVGRSSLQCLLLLRPCTNIFQGEHKVLLSRYEK